MSKLEIELDERHDRLLRRAADAERRSPQDLCREAVERYLEATQGPDAEVEPAGAEAVRDPSGPEPEPMAGTRRLLLKWAQRAEASAPPMPSDMAEQHDHYAHGKPRS